MSKNSESWITSSYAVTISGDEDCIESVHPANISDVFKGLFDSGAESARERKLSFRKLKQRYFMDALSFTPRQQGDYVILR
jgi:hypothetical protein